MASAHVIRSRPGTPGARYLVRYRLRPGESPRHAGSFKTRREADARLAWVLGELAAMRVPDVRGALSAKAPPRRRRLDAVGREWLAGRVDLPAGGATQKAYAAALGRLERLSGLDPAEITREDVQAWISALATGDEGRSLAPKSIQAYLAVLRQVLDHAGREPNPARGPRLRVPRVERVEVDPPSRAHVALLVRTIAPRWRLAVLVLEATGMRVGELVSLTWGDVESRRSRWRVRQGKTAAARRWVSPSADLFAQVDELVAREDRGPERRVFAGVTESGLRGAMGRACAAAGIPHYSPHDLRHRFISRLVAQGLSIPEVARLAGHSRGSLTLDVYSHVLMDEGDDDA